MMDEGENSSRICSECCWSDVSRAMADVLVDESSLLVALEK